MSAVPRTAMVLAAGLGLRLRPLTADRPNALVEVGGRALIDHALDRLVEAGVERAVVNVHAFADRLEAHLRRRSDIEVVVSDERDALLETGGAVRRARAWLGEAPILVLNGDYVWVEPGPPWLQRLAEVFDPARMDALVTVVPKARTAGFDTGGEAAPGDFFRAADGRLTHREEAASAPYHCFGVQVLDPRPVYAEAADRFSLFRTWMAAQARGRLYGLVPEGLWMQVGDPAALAEVEARLAATRAGEAVVTP